MPPYLGSDAPDYSLGDQRLPAAWQQTGMAERNAKLRQQGVNLDSPWSGSVDDLAKQIVGAGYGPGLTKEPKQRGPLVDAMSKFGGGFPKAMTPQEMYDFLQPAMRGSITYSDPSGIHTTMSPEYNARLAALNAYHQQLGPMAHLASASLTQDKEQDRQENMLERMEAKQLEDQGVAPELAMAAARRNTLARKRVGNNPPAGPTGEQLSATSGFAKGLSSDLSGVDLLKQLHGQGETISPEQFLTAYGPKVGGEEALGQKLMEAMSNAMFYGARPQYTSPSGGRYTIGSEGLIGGETFAGPGMSYSKGPRYGGWGMPIPNAIINKIGPGLKSGLMSRGQEQEYAAQLPTAARILELIQRRKQQQGAKP